MPSLSAFALSSATAAEIWGIDVFEMKEMEHKPHEGAAGQVEEGAGKQSSLEGVGGRSSWRGKRLAGWEIEDYWRDITHFPIYHTFPLKNHHCCLFLMQKDPGFYP